MPVSLILLVAFVQGITEFLPISSSGHLALIPMLTSHPYQGQILDVAAHIGTLVAVAVYLRSDLFKIMTSLVDINPADHLIVHRQLGLMILFATLPIIFIGYLVNYAEWQWLTLITTLAWANLIFAFLLWAADHFGKSALDLTQMRWAAAFTIGLLQVFSLIPGASRSGVTITAARCLGYDRVSAARFSLLLSIPVILGAGFLKVIELIAVSYTHLTLPTICSV